MVICDYCRDPADEQMIRVSISIDRDLSVDRTVVVDLHDECFAVWKQGVRAVTGARPVEGGT